MILSNIILNIFILWLRSLYFWHNVKKWYRWWQFFMFSHLKTWYSSFLSWLDSKWKCVTFSSERRFRRFVALCAQAHVTARYICVCACKGWTMGPVHGRHCELPRATKTAAQQQLTQSTVGPRASYLPPTGQPEPFCVLWPSRGANE